MTTLSAPALTPATELALRDQLSTLQGLLALSMLMTERGAEDDIVYLAATAVPALGRCRIEGVYLVGVGWRSTTGSCERPEVRAYAQAQLTRLGHAGGTLTIAGQDWAWAFPLRSFDGPFGYLVMSADAEPSDSQQFLLRVLAQQTGIAIANARLHTQQRAATADLRSANAALADTVEALHHKTAIHDRLTQVAIACEGQQGIARALHELTGFPAAVEDRHGNLLAWAGPEPERFHRKSPPTRRERILELAARAGRPVRADGCLLVVARPREDVLGVLLLIDPQGRAGARETVALEHGATVLAMELARLRSLADTELRLGRDIASDLIDGSAADSTLALARARAMGYDLERPHRVLVVEGAGRRTDPDALFHAVRHAAGEMPSRPLLLPRADTVVVLAASTAADDWDRFRSAVASELGTGRCAVGVGGVCHRPTDFPRSHREALRALRLREPSGGAVVRYDDLGVYQLLSEAADTDGIARFVRRWLGALLDYDARRHTELVLTLGRYLDCGGNYDDTARALAVGRSSLKYRLRRIREISGHDLSDPDTRLNLHLSTRAWRTLSAR